MRYSVKVLLYTLQATVAAGKRESKFCIHFNQR